MATTPANPARQSLPMATAASIPEADSGAKHTAKPKRRRRKASSAEGRGEQMVLTLRPKTAAEAVAQPTSRAKRPENTAPSTGPEGREKRSSRQGAYRAPASAAPVRSVATADKQRSRGAAAAVAHPPAVGGYTLGINMISASALPNQPQLVKGENGGGRNSRRRHRQTQSKSSETPEVNHGKQIPTRRVYEIPVAITTTSAGSASEILLDLEEHVHSVKYLESEDYPTHVPKEDFYEKCQQCKVPFNTVGQLSYQPSTVCVAHRGKLVSQRSPSDPQTSIYTFTCCPVYSPKKSCRIFSHGHDFGSRPSIYASALPPSPYRPTRKAIAIDCEMGGVGRMSELIEIVAIDYITNEVLLNTLVDPALGYEIDDFRTRFSGVTRQAFITASRTGTILSGGWREARKKLFEFMDENTIIVGHNVKEDLRALRISHARIVDSQLLVHQVAGVGIALKRILKEVVGRDIQNHGRMGHSCIEDAFAARDAVLWFVEKRGNSQQWLVDFKHEVDEKRRLHLEKVEAARKENEEKRQKALLKKEKEKREMMWEEAREVMEMVMGEGVWVDDGQGAWVQSNGASSNPIDGVPEEPQLGWVE